MQKPNVKIPRLLYVIDLLSVGLPLDVDSYVNYVN